jgi:hypothetical protein
MKTRNIFIILLLAGFVSANAQSLDDFGRIALKPLINSQIPAEASTLLETRMTQILTGAGIASTDVNPRFVMTATVNVLTKDIVPGPPQMVSQRLEITFTVGDIVEKRAFSTTSVTLVGVGGNENKAFIEAIKKINANNAAFKGFIDGAKTEIVRYYQTNCEAIIRDAKSLASQGKFSQAIYSLSLIPDVCTACYERSLQAQSDLYRQKTEAEGRTLFQQAKAAWAQAPNKENASRVSRLVSQISPGVSFIGEVNSFISEVSAVVQAQQQQEWEQYQKEWEQATKEREERWAQEVKERDRNYADQRQDAERSNEMKKLLINSCREVAVEYAKNQPKEVYNNHKNDVIW